mgnify:CR=1 FL=1
MGADVLAVTDGVADADGADADGVVGEAADEMYIVKNGEFEVLQKRKGVNVKVNTKETGDHFGELSLFTRCERTATVAAVSDSIVLVLQRGVIRK